MTKLTFKQTIVKAGRTVAKYSPEIYTTVGVVGLGATAYLAYKSRDKVEKVVMDIEEDRIADIEVSPVEVAKDLTVALYLPITVGVLSVGSILMAHKIQRKRILALTGALAAQQAKNLYFENKYRAKHGEEAYEEFMIPTEQIKRTEVDEKGVEKQVIEDVKKEVDSTIGEWYDQSTEYYDDDHGYNMSYIDSINETLQTRLFQRGTLLLNEVREELGFERIRAGALLGWTSIDNFDLRKAVTNFDTEEGDMKQQIFVSWTTPKYIYDNVEFNSRYSNY